MENNKAMKKNQNIQIFPPEGYEIDTTSVVDNTVVEDNKSRIQILFECILKKGDNR